jgi:amidase
MTSPTPSDLLDADAARIVQALADRKAGALELCDAAIARIEQRDREINAVVVRDFERAREQARAADAALARGERRPLLGLPMTVKESFNLAGLPTTWGFEHARDFVPTEDAVAVQRLKAAGAVILGKTNVPVGLADWQTANPIHGRTLNPLDPKRTPGGSSGGSAAALAARMVPLELGSDIGGSIRVPAHCCGVAGHKPSHDLLPRRGHQFPRYAGAPDTLSVIGPMARRAADLELALGVLAGPDRDEAVAYRLALPPARHQRIGGLRVLVIAEHPVVAIGADVRAALERVAAALQQEGATVARTSPLLPDLMAAHETYVKLLMTLVLRGMPDGPPPISSHEWLAQLDKRAQIRAQWRSFFGAFDIVLAPIHATPAFESTDEPRWEQRTLVVDGQPTRFEYQTLWAGIASLAGLPATVVPAGRAADGMPVGVQIIGPYLEDRTPLAVARWVESLALV